MLVAVGESTQTVAELAEVGGSDHRTVSPQPAGAQQGRGHVRDVDDRVPPIQVVQDRGGVLADQVLGVRAQQNGDAPVGQGWQRSREACLATSGGSPSGMATIAWALVPLMPNADTAAIRWPFSAGHGVRSVASRKPCSSQLISRLACRCAGWRERRRGRRR